MAVGEDGSGKANSMFFVCPGLIVSGKRGLLLAKLTEMPSGWVSETSLAESVIGEAP